MIRPKEHRGLLDTPLADWPIEALREQREWFIDQLSFSHESVGHLKNQMQMMDDIRKIDAYLESAQRQREE